MFGMHLTLDCYQCNKEKLNDLKFVSDFLDSLPEKIEMRKLKKPSVVRVKPQNSWDSGGISGFVILAESHASLHSFTDYCFLTADIYSCKEFDAEKATMLFVEAFEAKKVEKNIILRGLEFERSELLKEKE